MLLAAQNHHGAFAELGVRHTRWLLSLVAKLVGSSTDAEELAQDVWLSAWASRTRYVSSGRFRLYLATLAKNRIRNHVRTRVRRPTVPLTDLDAPRDEAKQLEQLLKRERSERLLTALARLEPKQRETLVLRFAEELSYDEIAEVLDSKPTTLRARVHHALVSLKNQLTKSSPDRDPRSS